MWVLEERSSERFDLKIRFKSQESEMARPFLCTFPTIIVYFQTYLFGGLVGAFNESINIYKN
jgi:hypothetical protein